MKNGCSQSIPHDDAAHFVPSHRSVAEKGGRLRQILFLKNVPQPCVRVSHEERSRLPSPRSSRRASTPARRLPSSCCKRRRLRRTSSRPSSQSIPRQTSDTRAIGSGGSTRRSRSAVLIQVSVARYKRAHVYRAATSLTLVEKMDPSPCKSPFKSYSSMSTIPI
jgi:hypothetical protein